MLSINDDKLKEFTNWYFDKAGCMETPTVYFSISLEGYLHIGEKEAKQLLKHCKQIGLVSVERGMTIKTC